MCKAMFTRSTTAGLKTLKTQRRKRKAKPFRRGKSKTKETRKKKKEYNLSSVHQEESE